MYKRYDPYNASVLEHYLMITYKAIDMLTLTGIYFSPPNSSLEVRTYPPRLPHPHHVRVGSPGGCVRANASLRVCEPRALNVSTSTERCPHRPTLQM